MAKSSIEAIRHSLAHLLGAAVLELYPGSKLAIGPAIDDGFYYDIDIAGKISDADLPAIEDKMRELLKTWRGFEGREVSADEARNIFADNQFKEEIIHELEKNSEKITLYTSGTFTDLCRGGHVEQIKDIDPKAFKLSRLAGAYWRGNEHNPQLTRIYGFAFNSKKELDEHLHMLEEAKKRDHKKIGKDLDLFAFSETVGKGLPLFTPKGSTIRRELERFIVDEELKRGYLHVYTPDLAKLELYEKSGHYPHYKDSMYAPIEIDEEKFMLRPMTCPHHFELYLRKPVSYRELPMRIAELAKLYRYEQSGELSGLQRVRAFCLADAHIICASEEQAADEVGGALDLIEYIAGVFGLKHGEHYWYRLSLGDRSNTEKYYKNDAAWDIGEDLLRKLLKKRGSSFIEAKGEAAFYGPKVDIQMKNVNGKEDTAFTVQYDFCMPTRFNLTYHAEDGTEKQCVVVHRSSIGAIERIMAFLIEHYAGAFPLWLSPVQAAVITVSDKQHAWATSVTDELKRAGIRAELHVENETLGKKIRSAELQKIPYLLIIGDKEVEAQAVAVRKRGSATERERGSTEASKPNVGDLGAMPIARVIEQLREEIMRKS